MNYSSVDIQLSNSSCHCFCRSITALEILRRAVKGNKKFLCRCLLIILFRWAAWEKTKVFLESLVLESWRLCCSLYGTGKACKMCFISTTVLMGSVKSFHSSLLFDEKSCLFFILVKNHFMYIYQSIFRLFSLLLRSSGFICLLLFRYWEHFPAALFLPVLISLFFRFPFCTFARIEEWLKISASQKKKWRKKKINKKSGYCSPDCMYIIFLKESTGT